MIAPITPWDRDQRYRNCPNFDPTRIWNLYLAPPRSRSILYELREILFDGIRDQLRFLSGAGAACQEFLLRNAPPPGGSEIAVGKPRSSIVLDAMYLAIGFGFLGVTVLYVFACDRL